MELAECLLVVWPSCSQWGIYTYPSQILMHPPQPEPLMHSLSLTLACSTLPSHFSRPAPTNPEPLVHLHRLPSILLNPFGLFLTPLNSLPHAFCISLTLSVPLWPSHHSCTSCTLAAPSKLQYIFCTLYGTLTYWLWLWEAVRNLPRLTWDSINSYNPDCRVLMPVISVLKQTAKECSTFTYLHSFRT